ncbi:forkhead-associated domain-containing protein 1 isoform X2 [Coregonus clupeaformis]|uniref:forkhead-associated domain-containing protein 1 isoform X2 n=1 Tax=Coregonus clupeaformis TaxID=59861 RepID=UPI001E1C37DE|nr:forkhead-associated domain-containing protein 1 isoform X2 [Coregonus clupeaformis]
MRGYLKTTGWVFKLQAETTTVGTHRDCDLCLQNGGVEEHHAIIEWSKSEPCFVLSDLNSAHGTYVNDCRIHNAAVRLTPGDELHFGYGGSTYQLAVESPSMLPCPPMNNRTACQKSLQLKEEPPLAPSPSSPSSQLPLLPGNTSVPVAWVWGGSSVTPHPPSRARPASAGAKRTGQSNPSEQQGTTSCRPGSWTGHTGSGPPQRTGAMASQSSQTMQHLLQEKEERLLRLGDENSRLAVFESESQRKDRVIAGLRDETSALRHQLTQSQQTDQEIKHRLLSLERDINDKREQIERLKEQMVELQRGSSEVFRHTVTERDLKMSNLRGQMERLKRESSTASGLVRSLQRDLSSREKQALKLASEVDRLRQDIRHKDIQLGATATKFSKIIKKHQEELLNHEHEVITLKKNNERLEVTLRDKQRLLEHQTTERDSLKNRLEKKIGEQASMLAESEAERHTQQEKSKAELELVQAQIEHLRDQLLMMLPTEPSDSISHDALSDQQVLEQVAELLGERESLMSKVEELEGQLKEVRTEQERAAEDTERLKSRLETCQEACSANALEKSMTSLQEESVSPALAWVQASVLSIMATQLPLLHSATQALLEAGIDASHPTEGVLSGIRTLVNEHQGYKVELQRLKVDLEELQERDAKSRELQEILSITREELVQQRQQMTVAQHEEEARQKELEELNGELEALRQAQTTLQQEAQTQEAECCTRLEEAGRREEEWQDKVKEALEKGAEEERERYGVWEAEYREQVRQHAHTIVALEQRWVQSRQRAQEVEEEREVLIGQLRALEGSLESSRPVRSTSPLETQTKQAPEVAALEGIITSLRADLAQSQLETCSQGDLIVALSHDLAAANARITDMTGELSEQQKLELEQLKALVVDQRVQLSTLTQKLMLMSQLVEQKGEELEKVRDELRLCQVDLEKRLRAKREMKEQRTNPEQTQPVHYSVVTCIPPHTKDMATVTAPGELAKQGSKCRGYRHEEVIQHQREALSEMRARIGALEQTWPLKCFTQQGAPKKQAGNEAGKLSTQKSAVSGWPLPGALGEETLERTARLDLSDALDLSERTYLDLARALCEALELSEGQLQGCVSLQHLPQEERASLYSLRHADLELLRSRMALQHSQAQRRESLLQQQHREMTTLRESQAEGQQLQASLDTLRAELETESQESSLLREALRRTQSRLEQEIDLNTRAVKSRKAVSVERIQRRSGKTASHSCVRTEAGDTAAAKTSSLLERLKKREYEVETLKRQLGKKEFSKMASKLELAIVQQQPQQASPLTEPS